MDRPLAGGFVSLTALQAEGCGLPLCGNAYKVSVTGLTLCVIWHEKHSADWLTAFTPKGRNCGMVHEVYDSLFFPSYLSFPLEGKSREAGKGVRGRVPIGCSIAILTANRRPVSFLLLTLGHALQPPILKNGAFSKAPFCCRYLAISAGITFVSSLPEDFFAIL